MKQAVAGLVVLAAAVLTGPAVSAATIRIQGTGIVFEASSGETNDVVLNGPVIDDPLGDGFAITDTGARFLSTIGDGCRASGVRAVCAIQPELVKVVLGDRNDKVQSRAFVPMIVNGGPGNDIITGGEASDELDGDRGDDTIDAGRGDDLLRGGLGIDHLSGGIGKDRLIGGPGGDTLDGGNGLDEFDAGAGKDTILAQDGISETIRCGGGRDTVTRDANDDPRRCN